MFKSGPLWAMALNNQHHVRLASAPTARMRSIVTQVRAQSHTRTSPWMQVAPLHTFVRQIGTDRDNVPFPSPYVFHFAGEDPSVCHPEGWPVPHLAHDHGPSLDHVEGSMNTYLSMFEIPRIITSRARPDPSFSHGEMQGCPGGFLSRSRARFPPPPSRELHSPEQPPYPVLFSR